MRLPILITLGLMAGTAVAFDFTKADSQAPSRAVQSVKGVTLTWRPNTSEDAAEVQNYEPLEGVRIDVFRMYDNGVDMYPVDTTASSEGGHYEVEVEAGSPITLVYTFVPPANDKDRRRLVPEVQSLAARGRDEQVACPTLVSAEQYREMVERGLRAPLEEHLERILSMVPRDDPRLREQLLELFVHLR